METDNIPINKIVSILVAIIVTGCVLVPICNTFSNGDGSNGDSPSPLASDENSATTTLWNIPHIEGVEKEYSSWELQYLSTYDGNPYVHVDLLAPYLATNSVLNSNVFTQGSDFNYNIRFVPGQDGLTYTEGEVILFSTDPSFCMVTYENGKVIVKYNGSNFVTEIIEGVGIVVVWDNYSFGMVVLTSVSDTSFKTMNDTTIAISKNCIVKPNGSDASTYIVTDNPYTCITQEAYQNWTNYINSAIFEDEYGRNIYAGFKNVYSIVYDQNRWYPRDLSFDGDIVLGQIPSANYLVYSTDIEYFIDDSAEIIVNEDYSEYLRLDSSEADNDFALVMEFHTDDGDYHSPICYGNWMGAEGVRKNGWVYLDDGIVIDGTTVLYVTIYDEIIISVSESGKFWSIEGIIADFDDTYLIGEQCTELYVPLKDIASDKQIIGYYTEVYNDEIYIDNSTEIVVNAAIQFNDEFLYYAYYSAPGFNEISIGFESGNAWYDYDFESMSFIGWGEVIDEITGESNWEEMSADITNLVLPSYSIVGNRLVVDNPIVSFDYNGEHYVGQGKLPVYAINPASVQFENGSDSDSGNKGITGTLITIIPVFVLLAIIGMIAKMFVDKRGLSE